MKGRLSLIAVLLVLAGFLSACGGGNGQVNEEANGTAPGRIQSPPRTGETGDATPTSFQALRDNLADRLDVIKVNITAVPDDIQRQIVDLCQELDAFIDEDRVEEICGALDEAFDRGDPGRIDRVLAGLAELED